LVVKIEGENTIDSSCDQAAFLIAEVGEVDQSDRRHVNLGDNFHKLVEEIHLEISRYDEVKSKLVRECHGRDLSMCLGYLKNFHSTKSFS